MVISKRFRQLGTILQGTPPVWGSVGKTPSAWSNPAETSVSSKKYGNKLLLSQIKSHSSSPAILLSSVLSESSSATALPRTHPRYNIATPRWPNLLISDTPCAKDPLVVELLHKIIQPISVMGETYSSDGVTGDLGSYHTLADHVPYSCDSLPISLRNLSYTTGCQNWSLNSVL